MLPRLSSAASANWRSSGSGMRCACVASGRCEGTRAGTREPVAERRVRERGRQRHAIVRSRPYCLAPVRVHVVDPSSYTPPYDHALCRALGVAGAEVELITSRFAYGPVAVPDGYVRRELFYRAALGAPGGRVRMASKLAQHVPDMLRYRRVARAADVVHFQWLPVQHLDGHLLPRAHRGRGAPRTPPRAGGDVARSCSPPTMCSRASRAAASSRRSGACTTASTRSSCTPSTAARA